MSEMHEFDLIFVTTIFNPLLSDEIDLMKSETRRNFPKNK